jgi:hypothetical protein
MSKDTYQYHNLLMLVISWLVAHACATFVQVRSLLLVDDKQIDQLDQSLTLRRDAEARFYRLVPLVGS